MPPAEGAARPSPAPTPPRRGLLSRLPFAARMFPGAALTRSQVAPRAADWAASNRRDADREGPLWVVLGDSTAQGIGASRWDRGYAGQLRALLEAETGRTWRLLNLSRSGDRAEDVVRNQLPELARLEEPPELVSCVVGANDLFRTPLARLQKQLHVIAEALPVGAIMGTVPQGMRMRRAREINALITAEAASHGLQVADIWGVSGPPWQGRFAEDWFHPNDTGYGLWTNALAAAAGLRGRVSPPEAAVGSAQSG